MRKPVFLEYKGRFLAYNPFREKSYTAFSESQEKALFRRMSRLWDEWNHFFKKVEGKTQAKWVIDILHSFTNKEFSTSMAIKLHILEVQETLDSIMDEIGRTYPESLREYLELKDKKIRIFNPSKKSKHRGVSWFPSSKLWRAKIHLPDKSERVTYHQDEVDAALAYDEMAKEYYPDRPEFLNFVLPGEIISAPEWGYARKRVELCKYFKRWHNRKPKKGVYSMSHEEVDEQFDKNGLRANDGVFHNDKTDG